MSDLESQVAQLRRSNRRWKALALSALCALALLAVAWYVTVSAERERALRALVEAHRAEAEARRALEKAADQAP